MNHRGTEAQRISQSGIAATKNLNTKSRRKATRGSYRKTQMNTDIKEEDEVPGNLRGGRRNGRIAEPILKMGVLPR